MKILAYLILAAAILTGIGYSYRATYTAGHDDGYNKRVSEEAGTYTAAEQKGRQAQSDADQQTIGQLRQDLANETQAAQAHDQQLANLRKSASSLQRRLQDAQQQHPDVARWLGEPIPPGVLSSVCWSTSCESAAGASPGH